MKSWPKYLVAILLFFVLLPTSSHATCTTWTSPCPASSPTECSTGSPSIPYACAANTTECGTCTLGGGTINADGPWFNQNIEQFRQKVFESPEDEIFGERYTFAQVSWIMHSLNLIIFPDFSKTEIVNAIKETSSNPNPTKNLASYTKTGPLGLIFGTIGDMYGRPVSSGRTEVHSLLARFDLAAPVLAQGGFGYDNLSGIRRLWSASRNMAYLLMIVLLIASGFMVMFRVKINPQTAVTLQIMIPKIVITLLLVTFSYAIAGFVIDMIYVVLSFIIYLLGPALGANILIDPAAAVSYFATPGFWKMFLYYLAFWLAYILSGVRLITVLPAIFALLVVVYVMFILIKVWWMLLKTYITLIMQVVIAPWQIMLGILPGQSGFGAWLRNFIAQASVFVVVPLMFLVSVILGQPDVTLDFWGILTSNFPDLAQTGVNYITMGGVDPVITSSSPFPALPLFGSKNDELLMWISLGILALIPKTADMIRDALKVPPFKYGTAFGEAMGPIRPILTAPTTIAGGAISGYAQNTTYRGTATGGILSEVGSTLSRFGKK